jgi:nucleoside-diphosphate-sugar epimerase
MHIVVTGATGFIGSYLTRYLIQYGYEVTAVSRDFSADTYKSLDGAYFLKADVLSKSWPLTIINIKADICIHLASSNDIVSKNVTEGLELSVVGTKNTMDFCLNNNITRFIFFSTLQVYGSELHGNYTEENALLPVNDYGLNHLFAEDYVKMYTQLGKLNAVIVRPSNVFGRFVTPHPKRWTLVPACFCRESFTNQSITLLSSGKQLRNFISLENICRAVEAIISRFPQDYDVVNLCSTFYATIAEIAYRTADIYNNLFNRTIDVRINSTAPVQTNSFTLSMNKLYSYGFVEDSDFTIESEIEHILLFLQHGSIVL